MKGGFIAALVVLIGAGSAGAYLATRTPCSAYSITVAGNLNPEIGKSYNYSVTVQKSGKLVSGASVSLSVTGSSPTTGITGSGGVAIFPLTFMSAGEYSISATVNTCQSNVIIANAHEPCGAGYIFYNGACTPVSLSVSVSNTDYTSIPAKVTFTATLINSSNGSSISSYPLTLVDSTTGSTYNATTNSKGVAVFTVSITSYGVYNFEVQS